MEILPDTKVIPFQEGDVVGDGTLTARVKRVVPMIFNDGMIHTYLDVDYGVHNKEIPVEGVQLAFQSGGFREVMNGGIDIRRDRYNGFLRARMPEPLPRRSFWNKLTSVVSKLG